MAYFKSLREYLKALDKAGKLVTINSPINKDTELNPLVKLQFRGLPEEQRKGFLFTNVYDSRGKKYDMPVVMGVIGASAQVMAVALQCQPDELQEKIAQILMHPIEPRLVKQAPVQEVVYMGDNLLAKGGMDEFPVPISTVGYDAAPIQSASMWVTKDPETGIRNVGCYRSQLYAQDRLGIHVNTGGTTPNSTGLNPKEQNLAIHWQKCRAKGIPLQCAIVVGGPPNLNYVASLPLPFGVDAYTTAGAMAGEPVEMVKCKTVDLEVPANADVVIEGVMGIEELMMEAPHGEGFGYVGMEEWMPYMNITCITHRKDPIWFTQQDQLGPSESYTMPRIFGSAAVYKRLRYDLGLTSVLKVGYPEFSTAARGSLRVIQMKMWTDQDEVWRALEAAAGAKLVVAVDDDIDPWHPDVFWFAVNTRSIPHRDSRITKHRYAVGSGGNSYALQPTEEMIKIRHHQFDPRVKLPFFQDSSILLNATLKWPTPPLSLPKKEYMEKALRIWKKEGLPPLNLNDSVPWYSHELGYWPKEFAEEAERAVKGQYYKTGAERFKKRIKVDFPVVKEFKGKVEGARPALKRKKS